MPAQPGNGHFACAAHTPTDKWNATPPDTGTRRTQLSTHPHWHADRRHVHNGHLRRRRRRVRVDRRLDRVPRSRGRRGLGILSSLRPHARKIASRPGPGASAGFPAALRIEGETRVAVVIVAVPEPLELACSIQGVVIVAVPGQIR